VYLWSASGVNISITSLQSQINWFLQKSGKSYFPKRCCRAEDFLASINQIERPFTPDSGKDFGSLWAKRQDQLVPDIKRLAKPNALMFFHIPLYETVLFCLLLLTIGISPESYSKADTDSRTGKPLDIGIYGQEKQGNAKGSSGFFEKGILKAPESDHTGKGNALEVKVISNGHCHGI
jgi:hypothetical protein